MESSPRPNGNSLDSTEGRSAHSAFRRNPIPKYLRIVVSYVVAGICLFWVFHDIHPRPLAAAMAHIRWWLWIVCVGLQFIAYFCVAYQWQLLLRPTGRLAFMRAAQAVFAGRFANDVLPMQLGYLVRCTLAARWMSVSIISTFPSLIVERLWDGIWLAAGIGMAALLLPLPPDVVRAADFFGAIILAGTVATAVFVLFYGRRVGREATEAPRTKFIDRVRHVMARLARGLNEIVNSGLLLPVLGLSLLKLVIQGAAFIGFLWAYHLSLPLPAAAAVFLAGYLGICVPSSPAGTGVFQVFVVTALILFGIDKSVAAGFALIAFVSITVPLATAGFFALAQSGVRLKEFRK